MIQHVISVVRSFLASRHFKVNQIVFIKGHGPAFINAQYGIVRKHCMLHTHVPDSRWVGCNYNLLREATDEEVEEYFHQSSVHKAELAHPAIEAA